MSARLVLVTGATGYLGGRLVPALLRAGYQVRVLVRSPQKLTGVDWLDRVDMVVGDASDPSAVEQACDGVHTAYYMLHSLNMGPKFEKIEADMAATFGKAAADKDVKQVVYLGGIANDEALSTHLASRVQVGRELRAMGAPVLELRAGIVLGSGSASFEMLRYLTEHLPAMITPKWAANRTQPIAVRDVLHYLVQAAGLAKPVDATYDIGGPDALTYRQMMQRYAAVAGLRPRIIVPVPLLTPKLSSLWVGLVTPVPAAIARPLVGSLINEVVVDPARDVHSLLSEPPEGLLTFDEAVTKALTNTGYGQIDTRWSDATAPWAPWAPAPNDPKWTGGTVLQDVQEVTATVDSEKLWHAIETLGGEHGWPGMNWAWNIRGALDRLAGGAGMRRGRRDPEHLRVGDSLDFWRVDEIEHGTKLRLRAEMKLPGTAWLEFTIAPGNTADTLLLTQRAVFRPRGLAGRAYWAAMIPFHTVLFPMMVKRLISSAQ